MTLAFVTCLQLIYVSHIPSWPVSLKKAHPLEISTSKSTWFSLMYAECNAIMSTPVFFSCNLILVHKRFTLRRRLLWSDFLFKLNFMLPCFIKTCLCRGCRTITFGFPFTQVQYEWIGSYQSCCQVLKNKWASSTSGQGYWKAIRLSKATVLFALLLGLTGGKGQSCPLIYLQVHMLWLILWIDHLLSEGLWRTLAYMHFIVADGMQYMYCKWIICYY